MPKLKMPRSSPSLDMTPMVDLAFLLVTFFMLTAQFRAEEPVMVTVPSSQKKIPKPDKDIMTITVDSAGRVFFDLDNKTIRYEMVKSVAGKYKVPLTDEEMIRFSVMQSFGVPVTELKAFINGNEGDRQKINKLSKGIPLDSANASTNQLKDWIIYGRLASANFYNQKGDPKPNKLRFAIKGDGNADYRVIKEVVKTFQSDEINVSRFNMLTALEAETKAQ
jgi:biopolymer transport protein ExbD